jgi:hypothetical protein
LFRLRQSLDKVEKESAEKQEKINALYSKYAEYLTEEDLASLNEKSTSINDIKDFSKELYSVVTPKIEAKIEALKMNGVDSGSGDNLKYTTVPNVTVIEKEDNKKVTTLLDKIKAI